MRLAGASATGGLVGALLLLQLPESAFEAIVPVLILLAVRAGDPAAAAQPLVAKREHAPAHGGPPRSS